MPNRLPTTDSLKPKLPSPPRRRARTAARGYGARWQRFRLWFLKRNPLCVKCQRAAVHVDHIIPVTGRDDPKFYEPGDHQPLCHSCHSRKTRREATEAFKTGLR